MKTSPTPAEEAQAFAVVFDADGRRVAVDSQRELDEALKDGATTKGPAWNRRRNRREARTMGRHAGSGNGRTRRARAHGIEYGPLVPTVDGNGRPLAQARPLTDEQIERRAAGAARKAARTPWRRPRPDTP